jgi:hypothetical protein
MELLVVVAIALAILIIGFAQHRRRRFRAWDATATSNSQEIAPLSLSSISPMFGATAWNTPTLGPKIGETTPKLPTFRTERHGDFKNFSLIHQFMEAPHYLSSGKHVGALQIALTIKKHIVPWNKGDLLIVTVALLVQRTLDIRYRPYWFLVITGKAGTASLIG